MIQCFSHFGRGGAYNHSLSNRHFRLRVNQTTYNTHVKLTRQCDMDHGTQVLAISTLLNHQAVPSENAGHLSLDVQKAQHREPPARVSANVHPKHASMTPATWTCSWLTIDTTGHIQVNTTNGQVFRKLDEQITFDVHVWCSGHLRLNQIYEPCNQAADIDGSVRCHENTSLQTRYFCVSQV